jgi:PPM family protein phosphatase
MPAPAREWREALDYAAISDVGLRRANNQDSFVVVVSPEEIDWLRRGDLFMVADGMGAHAAGELASKMATDFVSLTYFKAPDESPVEAIQKAFQDANERVFARGQSNADFRGMGTTSSALVLLPEGAVVAHVGDSRVYRLRNNQLDQLSFDHSLVWEMQATGKMRESEIQLTVPKNIITRSLGPYPQVQVDLEGPFAVDAGDAFLLCSDGLSGQVEDDEIGCILGALPPSEAIQTLVDLANLRGGPDNITVIAARVLRPLTAARADSELGPARSRPSDERDKVHLASWITLAVLVLVALSMAFLQKLAVAAAAGVAAALAGVFIVMQRASSNSAGRLESAQLGKGPYRSVNCAPNASIVERLAKVVKQLRDAAMEEGWQIDWNTFNAQLSRAASATQRHDYAESVREHCRALISVMEQLRHQGKRGSQ